MRSDFGAQLDHALTAAGLSQRGFCRLVAFNQGSLQGVLSGRRTPPRDRAETWADALRLTGEPRTAFLEAYLLSLSPPGVINLVARLRAELAGRRKRR